MTYKHYRVWYYGLAATLDAINDSKIRTGRAERIISVCQNENIFTIFVETDE